MTQDKLLAITAASFCLLSTTSSSQQAPVPTGVYLIINPFDQKVDGPFVENTSNSKYFGPASDTTGGISGIFLRVNWNDFEYWRANGAPAYNDLPGGPLQNVLAAILKLQGPITLSVGLAAGNNSPSDVLKGLNIPTINIPFPYPANQPTCLSMPDVWNDANGNFHGDNINHNRDFTVAYEGALTKLLSDVTNAISGTSVTLSSIKVSGINTGDVEIGIQGNNVFKYSDVPGCTTPPAYPQVTQSSTAAFAWLQDGYLPGPKCGTGGISAPVQRTWDNIAGYLYSKYKAYSYIMDVFNGNNFTPVGPQYCDYNAPQTCSNVQTACSIQTTQPTVMPLTTDYMLQLVNSFVNDTTGPVANPPVAVQTDGLTYLNPPAYQNQQPGYTPQPGVIVPCQANVNNHTIIGFQSATSQPIASTCQATDYESGFKNGVAHGASYLELDVPEFSNYIVYRTPLQVSTFLSKIDSSLSANQQKGGSCSTTQTFTSACR